MTARDLFGERPTCIGCRHFWPEARSTKPDGTWTARYGQCLRRPYVLPGGSVRQYESIRPSEGERCHYRQARP